MSVILAELGDNVINESSLIKCDSMGLAITDDTYPKRKLNITEIGDGPLCL